jgi:hypothetical protein
MHKYSIISAAENLSAATVETMLQLVTGATRRAKILGFSVAFPSVTSTDAPATIELLLQTDAGTASAVTPAALDQGDPAAISTAQKTFTAEPTGSTVLRRMKVTPIGGTFVYHFPEGEEITMAVSTRVGLTINSPAAQTGVVAELFFQE